MPRAWAWATASARAATVSAASRQRTGVRRAWTHAASVTPGQYADATYHTGPTFPDSYTRDDVRVVEQAVEGLAHGRVVGQQEEGRPDHLLVGCPGVRGGPGGGRQLGGHGAVGGQRGGRPRLTRAVVTACSTRAAVSGGRARMRAARSDTGKLPVWGAVAAASIWRRRSSGRPAARPRARSRGRASAGASRNDRAKLPATIPPL